MAGATSAASSSTVNFPVSDPSPRNAQPVSHLRPPHLPFRRISLPTAPSLMHRESVVSVASFDSLPEEGEPLSSSPSRGVVRGGQPGRAGKGRLNSMESPRRGKRRGTAVRPVDDARESKRRRVIDEFCETERAYVDGLELIYSHFLTPIIASLDTPNPLLDRSALTSVFSNFIDIWNLHRSFFSSLAALLSKEGAPLSPILLAHFPYLSLYNPFVTSFPSTIAALTDLISPPSPARANPQYSAAFAAFLSAQEADPRCGKLKLRDWLLTIVQRCPRYLLLLKDLISCTDPDDPEHGQLMAVHTLVSKITLSLNTSLHTHAQTLSLLSLQRSTPNLPFQLIVPGRTLLKRGPLLQLERSAHAREREFLLFSDCLIWLAGEDTERAWGADWGISRAGWSGGTGGSPLSSSPLGGPQMSRSRSKSEAEISALRVQGPPGGSDVDSLSPSVPTTPSKHGRGYVQQVRRSYHPPAASAVRRHSSSGNGEERWVYKGRAELVDLEVVVSPSKEDGEETRLEILSPEGSFVLYAGSEEERDEWSSVIRQAKAQLLVSLNITHPNSTLTSSSSTNHLRRTLQALPFPPSDERVATARDTRVGAKGSKGKNKRNTEVQERRGKVDHWVPAIWVPDEKTGNCMRCGRTFGWRRRRHHCRLCGRCVCASCSGRTFFISDPNSRNDSSKPARACDACYETVFPLLDPPQDTSQGHAKGSADTITSLSHFPSWLSMPALPVSATPQALMAIDRDRDSLSNIIHEEEASGLGRERVRLRSPSRPKSYHQILEDFEDQDGGRFDVVNSPLKEGEDEDEENDEGSDAREYLGLRHKPSLISGAASSPSSPRREDTARRNKRFSLPAVALQTTSVTARTAFGDGDAGSDVGGSHVKVNKRFSLISGGGSRHYGQGLKAHAGGERYNELEHTVDGRKSELGRGVAAGKLSELLGRKKD